MSFSPQISQGIKLKICVPFMLEKNKQYGIPYKVFWDKIDTWKFFNKFQSEGWIFTVSVLCITWKHWAFVSTRYRFQNTRENHRHLFHMLNYPYFQNLMKSFQIYQGWENCNEHLFFLFPVLNIIRMVKNA